MSESSTPVPTSIPEPLLSECRAHVAQGDPILAVKLVRETYRIGLVDAVRLLELSLGQKLGTRLDHQPDGSVVVSWASAMLPPVDELVDIPILSAGSYDIHAAHIQGQPPVVSVERSPDPDGFTVPSAPARPGVAHFDGEDITTDTPAPERLLGWLPEGWRVHRISNRFYGPNGEQVFTHGEGHVVAWGSKHEGIEAWTEWTEREKQALVLALANPEAHLDASDALQAVLSNLGLSERYAELWSRYKGAAEPELMTTIETIREALSLGASFRRVLDVLPDSIRTVVDRMPEAINAVAKLVEEKGGQSVYQDSRVARLKAVILAEQGRKGLPGWTWGQIDEDGGRGWRRVTPGGTFFAWSSVDDNHRSGWSFYTVEEDGELNERLSLMGGLRDVLESMERANEAAPALEARALAIQQANNGEQGLEGWVYETGDWVFRDNGWELARVNYDYSVRILEDTDPESSISANNMLESMEKAMAYMDKKQIWPKVEQ